MRSIPPLTGLSRFLQGSILSGLVAASVSLTHGAVLDDFNDNSKSDWSDFTFIEDFGIPSETGGQFVFDLPGAGQDIFTASQKISEVFELKEGRTITFTVDVMESTGEDTFAVLAFIPNTGGNSPGTLAGYGIAKDPTDVLITKGIQKYFVADDSAAAQLQNENITLSLTMAVADGNVTVTGRVIDKVSGSVLWEQSIVDTPGADVMADGSDDPAPPFITTGYFTLYCYQQFNGGANYRIAYDNATASVVDAPVETVLDNFDDNTKTDWSDFTFIEGFGIPSETGGLFIFDLPGAGQDIFTASQKISREISLEEGSDVELRVDVMESTGEDTFAVLAFIPNTGGNSPGTLAGYGIAKDPTDVLITKGIQKYFVADDSAAAQLQNENITLSLRLVVEGGNVSVTGKVIDKTSGSILWEQTIIDTPGADVMADGSDDPAAPFITTGYFTLYCYQQFNGGANYRIAYDNAVLVAPPLADKVAPIISDIQPTAFANFLPASSSVSFKVSDDQALTDESVSITLNGTTYTAANGLTVSGTGTSRNVSLSSLEADVNYEATLQTIDSDGLTTTRTIYFDTFLTSHRVIEAEDYNFEDGQFINDPIPSIEGVYSPESYSLQYGSEEIDFHDTRASASAADNPYREPDGARTQRSRDFIRAKFAAEGGAAAGVYDFDVGDIASGEWMNYTRNFTAGNYQVYLRESLANMRLGGESRLERVTSGANTTTQTTQVLGSFLGEQTGFQYRNFPLTDGTGTPVILNLSGSTTLRLHQVTADPADGARLLNYLVFIPVPDPGIQRATVISVVPNNGSAIRSVRPVIQATLLNRDTSVQVNTVQLDINGSVVPAAVVATADGASLSYAMTDLPASGAPNTATITFLDSEDVEVVKTWEFTVEYSSLNPANAISGTGTTPGMNVRMVQAPPGTSLEASLARAEEQLRPGSSIEVDYQTNVVDQVINYSQNGPGSADGNFPNDAQYPGIEPAYSTDLFSIEVTTYIPLTAGTYRFGTRSDDGYKVQCVSDFSQVNTGPLAFWSGVANATYDFVVTRSGLYPFRLVHYEQSGGAYLEWFVEDLETGAQTLINAADSPIKAYIAFEATAEPPVIQPPVHSGNSITITWAGDGTLQESDSVNGPWTVVPQQSPATITVNPAGNKFYRVLQ
jgi:TolB-like protein/predicted small secreted protein